MVPLNRKISCFDLQALCEERGRKANCCLVCVFQWGHPLPLPPPSGDKRAEIDEEVAKGIWVVNFLCFRCDLPQVKLGNRFISLMKYIYIFLQVLQKSVITPDFEKKECIPQKESAHQLKKQRRVSEVILSNMDCVQFCRHRAILQILCRYILTVICIYSTLFLSSVCFTGLLWE